MVIENITTLPPKKKSKTRVTEAMKKKKMLTKSKSWEMSHLADCVL